MKSVLFLKLTELYDSMKAGAWATWWAFFAVVAELVVALVIYRELKRNREDTFLEEAFGDKLNEGRREIYGAYLGEGFKGSGPQSRKYLWHHSQEFAEKIFGAAVEKKDTKFLDLCFSQITHFNKLAFLYERHTTFNRYSWFRWVKNKFFHRRLAEWPHVDTAVICWIIFGPVILKRASSSELFRLASFTGFTLACLDFINRDKESKLLIFHNDPKVNITIENKVLSKIRGELKKVIKARSRLDIEKALNALNDEYEWPVKTAS
ncbi:MAG: hypothetical protein ACLPYZ_00730 [Limisphaerales bacterium]